LTYLNISSDSGQRAAQSGLTRFKFGPQAADDMGGTSRERTTIAKQFGGESLQLFVSEGVEGAALHAK
jgi:hypothetical protein